MNRKSIIIIVTICAAVLIFIAAVAAGAGIFSGESDPAAATEDSTGSSDGAQGTFGESSDNNDSDSGGQLEDTVPPSEETNWGSLF